MRIVIAFLVLLVVAIAIDWREMRRRRDAKKLGRRVPWYTP